MGNKHGKKGCGKRVVTIIAAFALVAGLVPSSALAAQGENTPKEYAAGEAPFLTAQSGSSSFDVWYESAWQTAFSADHVIGTGGDLSTNYYTVVMPGETIGIYPDASSSQGPAGQGSIWYLNYSFIQLDASSADTEHLVRSNAPDAPFLTKVKEETLNVHYGVMGDGYSLGDGDIVDFQYTSIYRNDTGLPIVIKRGELSSEQTYSGEGVATGGSQPVQSKVTVNDGATLHFLEPTYNMSYADPINSSNSASYGSLSDLYWSNSTKTVPAFPSEYYIDATEHTYTLPNPVLKGGKFVAWHGTYANENGIESDHILGKKAIDEIGETYANTNSTPNENCGLTGVHNADASVYTLNAATYVGYLLDGYANWGGYDWAKDVTFTPTFRKSSYTHTIGFNPEGGTVEGKSYYICEDYDFALDVDTVVPVRSGYTFKGWCKDKSNPSSTLITGSGTSSNVYGTSSDNNHSELYAVWEKDSVVDISTASVGSIANQTYTGSAIKPAPTVKDGTTTLVNGTDYTLSYKDNTNVGTATVTITGKNDYTGSKDVSFKIVPASIATATVTLSPASYTYTGSALKPAVTVKLGSKTLVSGTDYTVAYSANTSVGTAKATITGKGNYAGTIEKAFAISAASLGAASVTLSPASCTYTGGALKPAVTVKLGSKTLTNGTDYTVAYENNVNAGTAKVTVKGTGSYTGSVSKNYAIEAVSMSKAAISGVANKTYSGKALSQAPKLVYNKVALKAGADYTLQYYNSKKKAVKASSVKKAGTYYVAAKGKGNYSGTSALKAFKVLRASLAKASVASVKKQVYDGKAKKPSPAVKLGKKKLKKGTDYTLQFYNSKKKAIKASKVKAAGTYYVAAKGKGSYKGKSPLRKFKIVRR